MKQALILGCGNKKYDFETTLITRLDVNDSVDADVIHDLNKFPYPFDDSKFDIIVLDNVLEHLDDVIAVMEELHRITKPNAKLVITVPYFRSIWAHLDPTHQHFFTWDSLSYFDVNHIYNQKYAYTKKKFEMVARNFNLNIDKTLYQRCLIKFAEKYPNYYERNISQIFPLEDLTYELKVIK